MAGLGFMAAISLRSFCWRSKSITFARTIDSARFKGLMSQPSITVGTKVEYINKFMLVCLVLFLYFILSLCMNMNALCFPSSVVLVTLSWLQMTPHIFLLFKVYCQSFYSCSLWVNNVKFPSALQGQTFRMLLQLLRFCSASGMLVLAQVDKGLCCY